MKTGKAAIVIGIMFFALIVGRKGLDLFLLVTGQTSTEIAVTESKPEQSPNAKSKFSLPKLVMVAPAPQKQPEKVISSPSLPNTKLVASIVVSSEPEQSGAIFIMSDGRASYHRVGDEVHPGFTLSDVTRQGVELATSSGEILVSLRHGRDQPPPAFLRRRREKIQATSMKRKIESAPAPVINGAPSRHAIIESDPMQAVIRPLPLEEGPI